MLFMCYLLIATFPLGKGFIPNNEKMLGIYLLLIYPAIPFTSSTLDIWRYDDVSVKNQIQEERGKIFLHISWQKYVNENLGCDYNITKISLHD
jgi:hypothetical protein